MLHIQGRMLIAGAVTAFALMLAAMLAPEQFNTIQSAMAGTPAITSTVEAGLAPLPPGCSVTSNSSLTLRSLSAVKRTRVTHLCQLGRESRQVFFRFTHSPRVKAIWLPRHEKCKEAPNRQWAGQCYQARQTLRNHFERLKWVRQTVTTLTVPVWQDDVLATSARRLCIANVETHGSSHPYTQQGGAGGSYWGKYQWGVDDWQKALSRASAYYHFAFPPTSRADQAAPWEQDAVTAFAVAHPDSLGWDPWAECR